jgi:hypothetical protein
LRASGHADELSSRSPDGRRLLASKVTTDTSGRQASRQAGKQASRQAGKQASRQAGKQASRQAGRRSLRGSRPLKDRAALVWRVWWIKLIGGLCHMVEGKGALWLLIGRGLAPGSRISDTARHRNDAVAVYLGAGRILRSASRSRPDAVVSQWPSLCSSASTARTSRSRKPR